LILNYATSASGSIRVEIQDLNRNPLPSFSLEDSPLIWGDEIERAVAWKPDRPLKMLAGKPVRLRFVLKDADLYAIRFGKLR
jgi:hypothetical protein